MRPFSTSSSRGAALRLFVVLALVQGCAEESQAPVLPVHQSSMVLAPGYSQPSTLPTLIAGGSGQALAINANGRVAGESQAMVGGQLVKRAVTWSGNSVTDLGWLPGHNSSSARGINLPGVTVGQSCAANGYCAPFRHTPGSGMVQLDKLTALDGAAWAINNAGIVVGHSQPSIYTPHAVKWSATGVITDLHPANATWSVAYDINTSGTIVGEIHMPNGTTYAYNWNSDGSGNIISPVNYSARAISDNALITGNRPATAPADRPFLWNPVSLFSLVTSPDSTVVADVSYHQRLVGSTRGVASTWINGTWGSLPLGSYTLSNASAINSCGTIVGSAENLTGIRRPVRWSRRACE